MRSDAFQKIAIGDHPRGVSLSLDRPGRRTSRAVLYASAGAELTQYDVDASGASLVKKGSVRLPANVQYAWQHPSRKYLYVAWSDGGAAAAAVGSTAPPSGKNHGVSAFRIDPSSGALQPHRQIHIDRGAADSFKRRYHGHACARGLQHSELDHGIPIERRRHHRRAGETAVHAGYRNLRAPGACEPIEQDRVSGDARQRSDEGQAGRSRRGESIQLCGWRA